MINYFIENFNAIVVIIMLIPVGIGSILCGIYFVLCVIVGIKEEWKTLSRGRIHDE